MGYIQDLRVFIGTSPIIMVGAGVIIYDKQQGILLQQRTDNLLWGVPGGALELGEKLEDAARRELFEETGLIAHSLSLLHVFSGEELYNKYPNGDEVYNVANVYLCEDYSGTLNLDPSETLQVQFFPLTQLPADTLVNPPDRIVFDWLRLHLPNILSHKELSHER